MNFKSKKNIILRNFVPKWANEKTGTVEKMRLQLGMIRKKSNGCTNDNSDLASENSNENAK